MRRTTGRLRNQATVAITSSSATVIAINVALVRRGDAARIRHAFRFRQDFCSSRGAGSAKIVFRMISTRFEGSIEGTAASGRGTWRRPLVPYREARQRGSVNVPEGTLIHTFRFRNAFRWRHRLLRTEARNRIASTTLN